MRQTRHLMGMPATVEIVGPATEAQVDEVYAYLTWVDEKFSTYKDTSEISRINAGETAEADWSPEMRHVMEQCAVTKEETGGYFDIRHGGRLDPSGYVKGWAIQNAADMLSTMGYPDHYVEIAGDIQVGGNGPDGTPWLIGIRNPFAHGEIVKRVSLLNKGIATSGTSARGQHIHDPHKPEADIAGVVSLTVIAEKIVDADRFATAAFAMGAQGIAYIAGKPGLEGYSIDEKGIATFTPGFSQYSLV